MKTVMALTIALVMLISCNKETSNNRDLVGDYYYRLAMIDLDSTVRYSPIAATKITPLEIVNEAYDDDDNYCVKHPNSPRCKPLPVVLDYFTLSKDRLIITLKWKTSLEDNFDRYVIERSRDGSNYKPIEIIKPKGVGIEYTYKDVF